MDHHAVIAWLSRMPLDYCVPWGFGVAGGLCALLAWRAFRARRRLWRAPGLLVAALAPLLLGAAATGMPIVFSNAQLEALPSWQYWMTIRMGVTQMGDAPPQWFIGSGTACTITGSPNVPTGTRGDIGSQVPAADGGCFLGQNNGFWDARNFGGRADGIANATTAINAALATGTPTYLGPGLWRATDMIACPSTGSFPNTRGRLYGAGKYTTTLLVGSDFNMAAPGVVKAGSDHTQEGCEIDALQIVFSQPDFTGMTIADIVHYPPAIDADNVHIVHIGNVAIVAAWTCVSMMSPTYGVGGSSIDNVDCSSFYRGLQLDGAVAGVGIGRWDEETIGLTGNQVPVYISQGQTGAAQAMEIGYCDGCTIGSLTTFSQGLLQDANAHPATGLNIANLQLDSDGAVLTNNGGGVRVGTLYSTKGLGSTIVSSGGWTDIAGGFTTNSGTDPSAAPDVQVTGGTVVIGPVIMYETNLAATMFSVSGTGALDLKSTVFSIPNGNRSAPLIAQAGATGILKMHNIGFPAPGASTGNLIAIGADNGGNVLENVNTNNWPVSLPVFAAGTAGYYDLPTTPFSLAGNVTPQFATAGDFAPTPTTTGRYFLRGSMVEYQFQTTWADTHTTASGNFDLKIGGNMPGALPSLSNVPVAINAMSNVTLAAGTFPCNGIVNGGAIIFPQVCKSAGPLSNMTAAANFPGAGASVMIGSSGRFAIK